MPRPYHGTRKKKNDPRSSERDKRTKKVRLHGYGGTTRFKYAETVGLCRADGAVQSRDDLYRAEVICCRV